MAGLAIQFKKAVKYDARGRVAIVGPAGSGKSYTGLKLARQLAGPNGRIAAVDTEHGSLSKYADVFDFDVFELASYSPDNFMAALDAAEQGKYDVFVCDSLSHFWVGKDGALEFVDMASKRHRDQMGGWKDFRPHERAMVDRMIASPCHVIVTMRTKTEYVEEVNPNTGKKQRRKVGLQPVQREGLEYEFDLVGYMDEDNTFIVDKTRCSSYNALAIRKPSEQDFQAFCDWLKGAKRGPQPGSQPNAGSSHRPWVSAFQELRQKIGTEAFLRALGLQGYEAVEEIRDRETASRVYKAVLESTIHLISPHPVAGTTNKPDPQNVTSRPSSQRPGNAGMPREVEAIWKRIVDKKSLAATFSDLRKDLVEVAGFARGEALYTETLGKAGVERPDQFPSLGPARQAASALWQKIQEVANELPPDSEPEDLITEDASAEAFDGDGPMASAEPKEEACLRR